MTDLDAVVAALAASKKYRSLCADTVRRVAAQELMRQSGVKAAIKATKRRLHQVYGAFGSELEAGAAAARLEAAWQTGRQEEVRAACREVMALHSSTRERLPILDRFYSALWDVAGRPASVLDLGCGLNPLAWPWMGLPPQTSYVALDIDARRIDLVNRFLVLAGLQPLARCHDLLLRPPQDEAALALLLKMSPTLERQEEGSTLRLVDQVSARWVAVSFAVRSLAGREKGMVEHYGRQFAALIAGRAWRVHRLEFDTELVFVIDRTPDGDGGR